MKKYLTLIAAVLFCAALQAQTYNIHKKNGTTIYIPADEVEFVNFDEAMTARTTGVQFGNKIWATNNVGADLAWEPGMYFSWGNTDGYYITDIMNQEYCFGLDEYKATSGFKASTYNPSSQTYKNPVSGYGENWNRWRIPTENDFNDLIEKSDYYYWGTYEGPGLPDPNSSITGLWFVNKETPKDSIFIPAVGNIDMQVIDHNKKRLGGYWAQGKDGDYGRGLFFGSEDNINKEWRFFQAEERRIGLPLRLCRDK